MSKKLKDLARTWADYFSIQGEFRDHLVTGTDIDDQTVYLYPSGTILDTSNPADLLEKSSLILHFDTFMAFTDRVEVLKNKATSAWSNIDGPTGMMMQSDFLTKYRGGTLPPHMKCDCGAKFTSFKDNHYSWCAAVDTKL